MTDSLKTNRLRLAMPTVSLLLIAVMTGISVIVYGSSLSGLLLFLCFVIFYVLLPGLLIMRAIPLDIRRLSTSLAIGLFTGWALEIILYFVSDAVSGDIILYIFGPVLSLIYILIVSRLGLSDRVSALSKGITRAPVSAWIFFLLVLLYALMTTQYNYLSPALSDFTYVNPDKAYHMGLIDSLSHDYPLMSLWINGREINYHIFAEILYSIPVRLFHMDSDFLLMSCGPFFTSGVFSISLYSCFAELSSRPRRAGLYSLLVILSDLYIVRSYYNSIAFKFIITNDNAAGFGVAAAFVFLIILKKFEGSFDRLSLKSIPVILLLTAILMLTTGIKGPIGAVLIAAMWGTVFLGWLLRKIPFRYIVPLLIMTMGFALVYVEVLGSKGQSNAGGNSVISLANITNICFWKKPLIALLKSAGIPTSARLAIVMAVFLVFYLTAFFLPFCIGYIRELIKVLTGSKDYLIHKVFVYAVFAVGFIAMFVLSYSGHSQIYFGLVSVFYAPLIAFWFFEDLDQEDLRGIKRVLFGAVKGVFAISICITTALLCTYIRNAVPSCVAHADPSKTYDTYLSMSNKEYEAMQWIKDNTPEDSLLATDRYYSVSLDKYSYDDRWENRFFLYGTYSNRFCYIAGSGYNMRADEYELRRSMIKTNMSLYDIDNEDKGDTARELGVDYIVVSKRFTELPDLESGDYHRCYQNDEVDIYEVLEKEAS